MEAPEVPWDVFGAYPEGRTWDQKAVDGIPEPTEGAHLAGVGAAHLQSLGVDGNIWDSWILEDHDKVDQDWQILQNQVLSQVQVVNQEIQGLL